MSRSITVIVLVFIAAPAFASDFLMVRPLMDTSPRLAPSPTLTPSPSGRGTGFLQGIRNIFGTPATNPPATFATPATGPAPAPYAAVPPTVTLPATPAPVYTTPAPIYTA